MANDHNQSREGREQGRRDQEPKKPDGQGGSASQDIIGGYQPSGQDEHGGKSDGAHKDRQSEERAAPAGSSSSDGSGKSGSSSS